MARTNPIPQPNRAATLALVATLALALGGCGIVGSKHKPATPTVGNRIPILSRIESGAKVDPALAGVTVVLPPVQTNADWAQAGGTASKSYGHLALADAPARVWTVGIAGSGPRARLAAAPVVGGGTLYVMDTAGIVHAYDAATGAPRWTKSFRITGDGATSVFGGGVSFDAGQVYVTTGVGEVAALDAATGAEKWKVKLGSPLRGSPTIAFGNVFVMTQANQIIIYSTVPPPRSSC